MCLSPAIFDFSGRPQKNVGDCKTEAGVVTETNPATEGREASVFHKIIDLSCKMCLVQIPYFLYGISVGGWYTFCVFIL